MDNPDKNPNARAWSNEKMGQYIYNVMRGKAPLNFLVRESPDLPGDEIQPFVIYDGHNRMRAIHQFYCNKLAIEHAGDKYFFDDLPTGARNIFTSYSQRTAEIKVLHSTVSETDANEIAHLLHVV